MENVTVKDIVEMTGGVLLCGDENTKVSDICIDSREIKEGDLFVPIIGEKVDAHRFIESSLEIGAATLTSEHDGTVVADKPYIRVDDTEEALKRIGKALRERLIDIPLVAVTGSVGKTTTRTMIAHALASGKRTYQTEKNYNSQIGVPITLARMSTEDEIAVLELGISEDGQMDILSDMVKPDMAVVTTIGVAHIEFMKTRENIRKQKLSVIHSMKKGGTLFLNGDDDMLQDAVKTEKITCRTIFYGTESWCDYYAKDIVYHDDHTTFTCVHGVQQVEVYLKAFGKHNVANCVAAIAVANENGLPMESVAKAFETYEGPRQKIISMEGKYTIIDDTYNASPDSMKASINVLCDMPCEGRRIAVLGDMLELGDNSEKYHRDIGRYLIGKPVDEVYVIGELAHYIMDEIKESASDKIKVYSFSDNEEAVMGMGVILRPSDLVLFKASNGMHFTEIVEILKQS